MSVFQKLTVLDSSSKTMLIQRPRYIPIIAEIGINHNGDLELAKRLIKIAKDAGCDAVKFQKRDIEIVYTPEVLESPRESPWGTTQRDQKQGLEFGLREYQVIDAYCKEIEIEWSASAWDLKSLEFVESFSPSFHKVASALTTNIPFLTRIASLGRVTLVSTGMCTLEDVSRAVEIFKSAGTPIVLLHTVSTYPTPEEDLNLSTINSLAEKFGLPVGYSGHEVSVSPSVVAAALGACVIERHITLDRTMYGSDQSASLEENGLRNLVSTIRKVPTLIGNGVKAFAPGEEAVAKKLRYW